MPTLSERKEIKKVISDYVNFLNLYADTGNVAPKKTASVKFLKDRLLGADVFVYNDIDSSASPDNVINIFKYVQRLSDTSQGKLSIHIDTARISFDKVKYDKIRRYYFTEIKCNKIFSWVTLKPHVSSDTVINADTLIAKDSSLVYDTSITSYVQKITLYLTFEKENNVYKNYKIGSISKTGTAPRLKPLPQLVLWWMGLDEEWKTIFRKKLKLDEYPREFDLEKLTGQYELDVSNTQIKSLDPLRKFNNLEKIICTNTSVNSLDPITHLKNLKVLNISRTKIDTLARLDKLLTLEEFRCVGNGIESIAQVKELVNLIEFECSENNIQDIEPVRNLINLKELSFSLNIKIKDINAVKDLVNLEWLAVGKIDIRSLEPLKNLINLVHLDLFNTNITSLEPIRHLTKITYLNLNHNKMNSLEAIKNYRYITELYLSSSSINDLSEIRNYNFIRILDISNTLITELGPVHKFEDILVLKAQFTKIKKEEIQRFKKNHPRCQITYY